MFNEAAKTFFEFLKLAPRYLIALGVMAGFLLFANNEFLKSIGVEEFAQEYRPMLGLVLIVTVSLFMVAVCVDGLNLAKRFLRKRQFKRSVISKLTSLNEDEKQILRYYYAEQTRANTLRIDDGVVHELISEGIIYRSSDIFDLVDGCDHNITDFAWDYLNTNPHLLVGTTNTYRNDKGDWRV